MGQYGQIYPNYYTPIAKLNTARESIRYFVLVFNLNSRIFNHCLHELGLNPVEYHIISHPFAFETIASSCEIEMPSNPIQYHITASPFDFGVIDKNCNSNSAPIPIEYTDFSLPVIPVDSITGNCISEVVANQEQLNREAGSIAPVPFNFGTITEDCISDLEDGIPLDYTPITPPVELQGLYGETILFNCEIEMPSNPIQYHITASPFDFGVIDKNCNSNSAPIPIEYTDFSLPVIPVDSITGSCISEVVANQGQLNREAGFIDSVPFNFGTILDSCHFDLKISDADNFYKKIAQYMPQPFGFETISGSCISTVVN